MHYLCRVTVVSPTDYDQLVLARMIDFLAVDDIPWPRRLWDIGSLLALEELWEAGAWVAEKVLSQGACDWTARPAPHNSRS